MSPVLYLIPTPLGTPDTPCLLPHEQQAIVGLTDFVVEAEKTARAHLKHLGVTTPIRELNLQTLNEHTDLKTLPELLKPLQEGRSMGIVSEAGCPAVADPGANLVALAHKHGFEVRPLVGPSSLLLALMASGANGQSFAFKGFCRLKKTSGFRLFGLWNSVRASAARRRFLLKRLTAMMRCLPMRWKTCILKRVYARLRI